MRSNIGAGIVAGLIAGVVFGAAMQIMAVPTPDGARMPMMAMVANVVRSDSLAIGWVYHLFNSAVLGALFGWLLGDRIRNLGTGGGWGALYGAVWWVLGAQVLMPILLGMSPFASLMTLEMRLVALGSLLGHLLYGLLLGALFPGFAPSRSASFARGT